MEKSSVLKWSKFFGVFAVSAMFWACSSSDDKSVAGGSTEDAGIIAIKDLDVAGVTQKGPFVKGSAVTVQGIDCKTLQLTNEHFEGEVKSDKGDFTVKGVSLKSTCALFEVTGLYRSEITGKKSSKELTLRALTDLKDRENVNINILTNLEYERLLHLVTEKGKTFAEAKSQAEAEVLAAFDIAGSFEEFENLNIFESGEGNAALLAVSVMMQAETDDAGLAKRIDKFADSFAESGNWKDSATKATIADWAADALAGNGLDSIRKNIESWDIGDTVAAFEKYITAEFPDTVVLSSSSKDVILSSGEGSSSSSSSWNGELTYATGEYLNPDVKYDSIVDSRDGHVYKTVKIGNQVWMAENLNFETENSHCLWDTTTYCDELGRYYDWATAMDAAGVYSSNGKDCRDNKRCLPTYPVRGICPEGFHLPDSTEWNILIEAVGGKNIASTKLRSKTGWYNHDDDGDVTGTDDYGFSAAPGGGRNDAVFNREDFEAFFWSASEDGFSTAKLMNLHYVARLSSFLASYAKEYFFNIRCVNDESYVPTSSSSNIKYDSIVDTRDGQVYKTVKIGNLNWMAQNLNYKAENSRCYKDSSIFCDVYGRLYSWASAIDSVGLAKNADNPQNCGYGEICELPEVVQGVCPNGWHLPTAEEWGVLFSEVGGQMSAATYLKSMMEWNGKDSVGLSVLPAGCYQDGYNYEGRDAYFWTATGSDYYGDEAYFVHMETSKTTAFSYLVNKSYSYSVRCVEDGGVIASTVPNEGFDWKLSKEAYLNSNIQYDSIVDSRDGQVYKTVKIGDQVWMAQNLNYFDTATTPSLKGSSWCYGGMYDMPEEYPEEYKEYEGLMYFEGEMIDACAVAGRLYTWAAAIDSVSIANDSEKPMDCGYGKSCRFELPEPLRGICPEGWHLPTNDEWNVLFAKTGGKDKSGKALKSQKGWRNSEYAGIGGNGTNAYGFSAMAVGGREGGSFDDYGIYAYFWSASEGGINTAYRNRLGNDYDASALYDYSKSNGYSVRCLKD